MNDEFKTMDVFEAIKTQSNIEDFIESNKEIYKSNDLQYRMNEHLNLKGLSLASLLPHMQCSKAYLYMIYNGTRKPSREIVIQIAYALKLSLEECQQLLKCSGLAALYSKDQRDSIIIHYMYHKKSILDTNDLLINKGYQPLLND